MAKANESQTARARQQRKSVEQSVTGPTMSSQIEKEVAILKEELEKLKVRVAGPKINVQLSVNGLDEKVRGLKSQLDETRGELEKMKAQLGEMDVGRSEATFTFELHGVEALLADLKASKSSRSETFYCRG